jgi:hypothetical protein
MVRLALDHSCPANALSFAGQSGECSHAARGRVAKTPYFPKTISRLALLPGETSGSGRNPGSDGIGKNATMPNEFRESQHRAPGFRFRACIGRFHDQKSSCQPLLRREMPCAIPPSFSRENFLSGNDNGRISQFRARSGLRSQGKKTGNLGRFPSELRARISACSRFEIRADYGRVP